MSRVEPAYNSEFPLFCRTCWKYLKPDDFNGACPRCGNGTVQDMTPRNTEKSMEENCDRKKHI